MKVLENNEKNTVDYAELEPGDCFRHRDKLWMKVDYDQDGVCLEDGELRCEFCGDMVTPVNAEVQIID